MRLNSYFLVALTIAASMLACSARAGEAPTYNGKAVTEWIRLLNDEDAVNRERARIALVELVGQAPANAAMIVEALANPVGRDVGEGMKVLLEIGAPAVPALTATLFDQNRERRMFTVFVFRELGNRARSAAPALIDVLHDKYPPIRVIAIEALEKMEARSAIPDLLVVLNEFDSATFGAAAETLIELGVDSTLVVPALVKGLESGNRKLWIGAIVALYNLGRHAAPAVPTLRKLMRDQDQTIRGLSVYCLGAIGSDAQPAVPDLLTLLEDKANLDNSMLAARALGRINRHPKALSAMRELLRQPKAELRVPAARLLWRMEGSAESVPALIDVLKSGRDVEREEAISVLRELGPEAKAAVPALISLSRKETGTIRLNAISALGSMGASARAADEAIAPLVKDSDRNVRLSVFSALGRIREPRTAVALLRTGLNDNDVNVRLAAAGLLARIGPAASDATSELRKALSDSDPLVRQAAGEALIRLGKIDDVLPIFANLLRHRSSDIRETTATVLGNSLRSAGKPVVPLLIKALWDEDYRVRYAAAEALGRIRTAASAAVPALMACLREQGELDALHSASAEALGLIGSEAKPAIPLLRLRLKDESAYVRIHAALALWHLAKDDSSFMMVEKELAAPSRRNRVVAAEALWRMRGDKRAVETLIGVLREARIGDSPLASNEQYMSARALGRIGPPAKAAVPNLLPLIHHIDPDLRETVIDAICRIDPAAAAKAGLRGVR